MSFIPSAKHDILCMYVSVHLYTIMVCRHGTTIGMCQCALMAGIGMACYGLTVYCLWCAFMDII